MGGCSSCENEEPQVEQTQTVMNDHYFYEIPDQPDLNNKISILETRQYIFQKKLNNFSRILKTEYSYQSFPELTIQIQRGANIIKKNCFQSSYPYVIIQISPNGPMFETALAYSSRPIWYKIFQFKQYSWVFNNIDLILILQLSNGTHLEVGKLNFSFQELSDQSVHYGWYQLSSSLKHQPRLKLRIQYLHNKAKYFEQVCRKYKNIIECLTEKIKEIRDVDKKYPEIIT